MVKNVLVHEHTRDGSADHIESQVVQLFAADGTCDD
jgi:hypothetical protein